MNVYQLAMRYYLRQTWSFEEMLYKFFINGDAKFQSQKTNMVYDGYAPIYLEVLRRIDDTDHRSTTGNQGIIVELPDKKVCEYFEKSYSEEQLFCIIFAHWYGLPPDRIEMLTNRRYSDKCYRILDYFLFNQPITVTDEQAVIDRLEKPFKRINDKFLLFDNNSPNPIQLRDTQVVEAKPLMEIQHCGFGDELYKEIKSGELFVLIG
ncbi:MAG: hypothetical protein RRY54_03860 [Angelakisella sp.]